MIPFEEFKVLINQTDGASEEDKKFIIGAVEPLYKFNEFLRLKLGISSEAVDELLKMKFNSSIEHLEKEIDNIDYTAKSEEEFIHTVEQMISSAMEKMALNYEYPEEDAKLFGSSTGIFFKNGILKSLEQ